MTSQGIPETEKNFTRFPEFPKTLKAANIANLEQCYQCTTCSNGCPVAHHMDYFPHQIIHMSLLGLKNKVLQSKAIWICISCETCTTRCPNKVDIVHLMDVLRFEAIQEHTKVPINKIPEFHKVFLDEIRRRGRIHELQLILRYKIKTGDLFSLKNIREDATKGLKMFFKGKVRITIPKMPKPTKVQKIFKKVYSE